MRKNHINYLLYAVAIIATIIGKWHHELWLDECHVLGIVQESDSLTELWRNRACDGHPILYYLIFYPWRHLQNQVLLTQMIHTIMVAWLYYNICIKSPYAWYIKLLLIVSVLFMHEFSIINRPYVLLCGVILYCSEAYRRGRANMLSVLICCTAMCQLHVYGAVFAGAFTLLYILQSQKNNVATWKVILVISVLLANLLVLYVSIEPPASSMTLLSKPHRGPGTWSLGFIAHFFHYGYFAMHIRHGASWNNTMDLPLWAAASVAVLIVFYCVNTLPNWQSRLFYLVCTAGLVVLNLEADLMALRHIGFYFVAYLAAHWLSPDPSKQAVWPFSVKWNPQFFLLPFLLCQAYWGVYFYTMEIERPFSKAKSLAQYISTLDTANTAIAGHGDMSLAAPSMYLQRPLHNLRTNELARTSRWDRWRCLGPEQDTLNIWRQTAQLLTHYKKVLLILSIDPSHIGHHERMLDSISARAYSGTTKLASFGGAMMPREEFKLYRIDASALRVY
jgi:hypothetical protein